ncbi:hypothetical protein OYT1_ch1590 [Ferriphaselus amnicola]|uniref:Uncharacterized protein n=1 Tax=Ferriphaselus amnicola TaxID=1188319 RepID=A0A2Z6GCH4_9PROT|nr:hypothetical protein [Ferriphaselus amnicola]BBE51137.1 hypothetical protein OYT1_ch1590 [Ferriphaselus amnicola]
MSWLRENWRWLGLALLAIFVTAWVMHLRQPAPPTTVLATASEEVKNVPQVAVQIQAPLKVYQGGAKLKQKIALPAEVVNDDRQHVIASSTVDGDGPHTVTTVVNSQTGESHTFMRTDPLPWLAWDDHGAIGIQAGLRNGQQTVRINARQGIISIKAVHVGLVADLNQSISGPSRTDAFVGVGAEYRW